MYLSDRDLGLGIEIRQLLFAPPPQEMDTASIDLHLDRIETAKVWDLESFVEEMKRRGLPPVLGLGQFHYKSFAQRFAVPVPTREEARPEALVYREGNQVIVQPHGFFLWQTKEEVGTPEVDPRFICFVDRKSTRARIGLVVHMTAPTIHPGWWGKVTLEIANLGPFTLALEEGDPLAQIIVAALSSPPINRKSTRGIDIGQQEVTGGRQPGQKAPSARRKRKP
jgi:dCTP deaminase